MMDDETAAPAVGTTDQSEPRGMDRRTLIKRAAAVGAVAWAAPVITGSVTPAAAAGTVGDGCYKYQYNWWYGTELQRTQAAADANPSQNLMKKFDGQVSPAGRWHEECQPSDDDGVHLAGWSTSTSPSDQLIFKSNQGSVNGQCCKRWTKIPGTPPDLGENEYDWWQNLSDGSEAVLTFPTPDCIKVEVYQRVTGAPDVLIGTCGDLGTTPIGPDKYIRFEVDQTACPGCYFESPGFWYTKEADGTSITSNQHGGVWSRVIEIAPDGETWYPVYLKTWIACAPFIVDGSTGTGCTHEQKGSRADAILFD